MRTRSQAALEATSTESAATEESYQKHINAWHAAANRAKRVKLHHDSTSEPSIVSDVTDDSALIPTSVPEDTTEASDLESEDLSELSESSEEPSDESSGEDSNGEENLVETLGEEEVVNLRANRGQKPSMQLKDDEVGEDIRPFLKDFLPKLRAANEDLEAQKKAGTLESAELTERPEDTGGGPDTEEQYIEMNLDLGVLEEQNPDATDTPDSAGDENEGGENTDIMGKLMGREETTCTSGIQEVVDGKENT